MIFRVSTLLLRTLILIRSCPLVSIAAPSICASLKQIKTVYELWSPVSITQVWKYITSIYHFIKVLWSAIIYSNLHNFKACQSYTRHVNHGSILWSRPIQLQGERFIVLNYESWAHILSGALLHLSRQDKAWQGKYQVVACSHAHRGKAISITPSCHIRSQLGKHVLMTIFLIADTVHLALNTSRHYFVSFHLGLSFLNQT